MAQGQLQHKVKREKDRLALKMTESILTHKEMMTIYTNK